MRALALAAAFAAILVVAPAQAGYRCASGHAKPVRHGARAAAATVHVFRGVSFDEPAPAPAPVSRVYLRDARDPYGSVIGWPGGIVDDDGTAFLDPWLSGTAAGRSFVTWNFDRDRNGILRRREAERANAAFAAFADSDGDGRLSEDEIDEALSRVGA